MTTKDLIVKYLEDAEAAERKFEDRFATFGKTGEHMQVTGSSLPYNS